MTYNILQQRCLMLEIVFRKSTANCLGLFSCYIKQRHITNMASNSLYIREEKQKLRIYMKEKLKNMSQHEKIKQTYIITKNLLNNPDFKKAERIAIYVNMKNEVGTYDILKEAFNVRKQVFIPLTIGSNMKMVKLNSFDELKFMPKSKWGIIQPSENDLREDCLDSGGVEFVVVPGVAFTSTNLRLGHGKGYYDRFLANNNKITKTRCTTVGLAFKEQMVDELPTNENDFKLSQVIYPNDSDLAEVLPELLPPPEPFII